MYKFPKSAFIDKLHAHIYKFPYTSCTLLYTLHTHIYNCCTLIYTGCTRSYTRSYTSSIYAAYTFPVIYDLIKYGSQSIDGEKRRFKALKNRKGINTHREIQAVKIAF